MGRTGRLGRQRLRRRSGLHGAVAVDPRHGKRDEGQERNARSHAEPPGPPTRTSGGELDHTWLCHSIGSPGDGQYAGTGPASEPETQAIVALVDLIGPVLTIFYHQDLNRLSPSNGFEGQLQERYSALTGLPIERITGGTYTGVAATWIRKQTGNPSFIVELGPTLTAEQAATHAAAVADIAAKAATAG